MAAAPQTKPNANPEISGSKDFRESGIYIICYKNM